MRVYAQVKCYHCGFISGQVYGESNGDTKWEELRANPIFKGELPHPGEPLRCLRCHGPVFLDEIEKAPAPPVNVMEEFAGRRRRRKRQVAA